MSGNNPSIAAATTPVAPAPESTAPVAAPAPAAVEAKPSDTPPSEVKADTKPAAESPPPAPQPESLLGKKPEEKVVTPPPEATPKPQEEPPAPPAESAPVEYTAFTTPEGVQLEEKALSSFTDILKEFKAPQEFGQKLVDLYTGEVQKLAQAQQDAWQKTLDTWKEDVLSDPELGGNRHQTVLKRCLGVLNEFADDAFRDMLNVTGVGNHPAMFRFLNKIAGFVAEPKAQSAEGAKPPAPKPSRAERRYRNNGAQPQA